MAIPPGNKASIERYQKANIQQIKFVINKKTRPLMTEYILNTDNVNGYIRHLIALDMKQRGLETDGLDGE